MTTPTTAEPITMQQSFLSFCKVHPGKHYHSCLARFIYFAAHDVHLPHKAVIPDEEIEAASIAFLERPREEKIDSFIRFFETVQQETTLAPGTLNVFYSDIKQWLARNRVYLEPAESQVLKRSVPRNIIISEDEFLNREKIRRILIHSDAMLRAFILMAASSGARISEIMALTPDDLHYDKEADVFFFKVPYKNAKARKGHTYFYSHEADAAVREYLKVRNQYIDRAALTCSHIGRMSQDTGCLFCGNVNNMRKRMNRALTTAGMRRRDAETERGTITPHSFRKFADTVMKEHLGVNMGNELIGHDEGLSKSYRRYDPDSVKAAYRKVEPYLTIETPDDYQELKSKTGDEIEKVRSIIAMQAMEIDEMKKKQQETETALSLMLEFVNESKNKKKES